jgi:hypothetical protein
MTKFANKTFSSAPSNQAYRDNFDRMFDNPEVCARDGCGNPVKPAPPWTRAVCSIECERAHYRALGDVP